jgi:hypothetical protein
MDAAYNDVWQLLRDGLCVAGLGQNEASGR